MIFYEFYWEDGEGNHHFFAILPERRKDSRRITRESIMKWGWMIIGNTPSVKRIYFIKKAMSDLPQKSQTRRTGVIYCVRLTPGNA